MKFSHLKNNKEIRMVDISNKDNSERKATAKAVLIFNKNTFGDIISNKNKKGEIFNTSRLAGIMAAKKTSELIPLCHNININSIVIDFKIKKEKNSLEICSIVKSNHKTGVEMEALTACSIASLTIYDMCKSLDKKIIIKDIRLISKSGGKSGDYFDDRV